MKIIKDVLGCAYYPFCNKCTSPLAWCENWKKRKIGEKENKDET